MIVAWFCFGREWATTGMQTSCDSKKPLCHLKVSCSSACLNNPAIKYPASYAG